MLHPSGWVSTLLCGLDACCAPPADPEDSQLRNSISLIQLSVGADAKPEERTPPLPTQKRSVRRHKQRSGAG